MNIKREPTVLQKKARRGDRGYPLATVAYYGPDESRASKVAVGIIPFAGAPASELKRWTSETTDVRRDATINAEILAFVTAHAAKTVAMTPGIIGCPHEEGVDYPADQTCPQCPYWESRDRWTGAVLPEKN